MRKRAASNQKIMLWILAAYWALAALFYFAAGDGIYHGVKESSMVSAKNVTPTVKQTDVFTQRFYCETDTIDAVNLHGLTYGRQNTDVLTVSILNEARQLVASQILDTSTLQESGSWRVAFDEPVRDTEGKSFTLQITSAHGSEEDGITFYYGDSVSTSKMDVKVEIADDLLLRINGNVIEGQLCFSVLGTNYFLMGVYYWPVVIVLGLFLAAYFAWVCRREKRGMSSRCLYLFGVCRKYGFLLRQLVERDFKTKYKRSVLGAFWSFLNPLLTMLVQYVVFSTIFKSDIANFPVYLLTGIITFSYFGEVTGMCLTSITGNAGLITKVYVPKYIYPFSRAVSSTVNFLLSLIPLLIVVLLTRTPITKAILLVPFVICCAFVFSLGMGLLLSALMVFFRDMQFLWGVINMMWMYATPIFYPETIIPDRLMMIFKMNPMYHIIRAFRTILINGVSPEPKALLYCIIVSVIPLAIGVAVFKKSQDRFILYI